MTMKIFANKMGFPQLGELDNDREIPGIGEKISLSLENTPASKFEVTEVKRDLETDAVEVYVNIIE